MLNLLYDIEQSAFRIKSLREKITELTAELHQERASMTVNFCKNCVHYRDTKAEMPFLARTLTIRHMYMEVCIRPEFADPVNGKAKPCVILREYDCDGKPPKFVPRSYNADCQ